MPYSVLCSEFRNLNHKLNALQSAGVLIDVASIDDASQSLQVTLDRTTAPLSCCAEKVVGSRRLHMTIGGSPAKASAHPWSATGETGAGGG